MSAPKAVVFCGKCGNNLVMGEFPVEGSIQAPGCSTCIQIATREGYNAGRMSAIMELYGEDTNNENA